MILNFGNQKRQKKKKEEREQQNRGSLAIPSAGKDNSYNRKSIVAIENMEDQEINQNQLSQDLKQSQFQNNEYDYGYKAKFRGKDFYKISLLIARFKYKLKKFLIFRRPDLLNRCQLEAIHDRSAMEFDEGYGIEKKDKHGHNVYKRRQIGRKNVFMEKMQNFPAFGPFSKFLIVWDIFHWIIIMMNLFQIPYLLAFHGFPYSWFQKVNNTCLVINSFLRLNTSYFEQGNLIYDRWKITKFWFHTHFPIDLIANISQSVPVWYQKENPDYRWVMILYLVKTVHYNEILKKYKDNYPLKEKQQMVFELFLLIMKVLFFSHIMSCIWHYIGTWQAWQGSYSWLESKDLLGESTSTRYITSMYYTMISISTIGYGDISPTTNLEKCYSIFMTFISTGIFGFIVSSVTNIIENATKDDEEYIQKVQELNGFFRSTKVPKKLQQKCRQYLEYMHKEGLDKTKADVFRNIPEYLRVEVIKSIQLKSITKIPFIRQNFSLKFMEQVAIKLKEEQYGPDQIIAQKGDTQKRLYFIKKGNIEVYLKTHNGKMQMLSDLVTDDCFGQMEIFTQQEFQYNYRSKGVSQLLYIDIQDWTNILTQLPQDREVYLHLKDSIALSQNYQLINNKCPFCDIETHMAKDCQLIFYNPNKLRLSIAFNWQNRDYGFIRKDKRNITSINNQWEDYNLTKDLKCIKDIKQDDKFPTKPNFKTLTRMDELLACTEFFLEEVAENIKNEDAIGSYDDLESESTVHNFQPSFLLGANGEVQYGNNKVADQGLNVLNRLQTLKSTELVSDNEDQKKANRNRIRPPKGYRSLNNNASKTVHLIEEVDNIINDTEVKIKSRVQLSEDQSGGLRTEESTSPTKRKKKLTTKIDDKKNRISINDQEVPVTNAIQKQVTIKIQQEEDDQPKTHHADKIYTTKHDGMTLIDSEKMRQFFIYYPEFNFSYVLAMYNYMNSRGNEIVENKKNDLQVHNIASKRQMKTMRKPKNPNPVGGISRTSIRSGHNLLSSDTIFTSNKFI